MTYIIPDGAATDFSLDADGYIIPNGDAVDFNLSEDFGGGVGVYTRVPDIVVAFGTPWRPRPDEKPAAVAASFGEAPERQIVRPFNAARSTKPLNFRAGARFTDAPEKSIQVSKPWGDSVAKDRARSSPFDRAQQRDGASRISRFENAGVILDGYYFTLHENGHPRDIADTSRWWSSDLYLQGTGQVVKIWRKHPAYVSPVGAIIVDGVDRIPITQVWPDLSIVDSTNVTPDLRIKPADPIQRAGFGVGEHRDQSPSLPWGPSGFRDTTLNFEYPVDTTPVPVPGETIIIPIRRLYVVSNSAQIVRVSDGRDIPAQQVQVSISMDTFAWSMSASLSGAAALALVEGTDAEPVEVDITINGVTWRMLVDGWSLQEAADRKGGSIRGRGRAAYLASPYAPRRDYQEASGLNVNQLAGQELSGGWIMNWTAPTWFVPGGAWKYQNLAPMDAIARLAEAGGAFVNADREEDALFVQRRFPVAPWDFDTQTPSYELPRHVLLQRGSTKKPGQGKNAVFVHGGNTGGVLARVLRQGTAGDSLVNTIVDPLITDTVPARQRGIVAIAETLRQSTEQHELPLSPNLGGLILPGSIVAVGQGEGVFVEDWRGLVNGVSVTASAQRAGDRGVSLRVRQTLEIMRYFTE